MSKKSKQTIEELCISKTSQDLWDELNQDINAQNLVIHSIPPNSNYVFRLLGPFVNAKRIYTGGLSKIINKINIKEILNENKAAYDEACKVVDEYYGKEEVDGNDPRNLPRENNRRARGGHLRGGNRPPNEWDGIRGGSGFGDDNNSPKNMSTMSTEAKTQLANLYSPKKFWQKCILVNALCWEGTKINPNTYAHKIFALPTLICNNICQATHPNRGLSGVNITGLHCHDIQISKSGKGLNTQYKILLLPKTTLNEQSMGKVIEEGLYDIPSVIKEVNRKKYPYLYKMEPNYRMSKELMSCIMDEYKKFEEKEHLEQAEERINEIPREAFEEANNMNSGIGSLEVE